MCDQLGTPVATIPIFAIKKTKTDKNILDKNTSITGIFIAGIPASSIPIVIIILQVKKQKQVYITSQTHFQLLLLCLHSKK